MATASTDLGAASAFAMAVATTAPDLAAAAPSGLIRIVIRVIIGRAHDATLNGFFLHVATCQESKNTYRQ